MAFIAVYDANVLFPNTLRDLLIRIAQAGMVQARWTNEILDEMLRALSKNRPGIAPAKRDRLRRLMNAGQLYRDAEPDDLREHVDERAYVEAMRALGEEVVIDIGLAR
jgi:hypothetical protein